MSNQIGLGQDRWSWDRDKFAKRRAAGERDSYEMVVFKTLSRSSLGVSAWIKRPGVELTTHYDGLQVYQLRKTTRGVDQLQTLLVTPDGEILDFSCEPKDEEIPRPSPMTREQIKDKLREKGLWPRRRLRR